MTLPRQDPYLEDKNNYARIDSQWLANLIDIFNSAMSEIESEMSSLDARITALGG